MLARAADQVITTSTRPSRLLDSCRQARGPHQAGDGGALHWRERARYHLGSTRGATLSTVTSREALLAASHTVALPAALALGLMPRGGIWGYMLDTSSISWHLDPSDRVVITTYRIRNAVCVWSDSGAELATAELAT
eukprot:CAMPEP_0119079712 /NCGR_PEP_ID=MMETSP1178-20130426/108831_1 /TAXON_ID=33656 /ORGANISM="unid sp, Strain CCMP2000" /LENGTH=136 /DNA_ID=CAMNT_0007062253 /DNA_START=170 /DNA_END=577 /DNA_ORIENTATION=+